MGFRLFSMTEESINIGKPYAVDFCEQIEMDICS